jgi:hypothetical protein
MARSEDMALFLSKVKELRTREARCRNPLEAFMHLASGLSADAETMASPCRSGIEHRLRTTVQGKLLKEIVSMLRHGARIERKQVPGLLSAISAYQKDQAAVQLLLPELGGLLSSFWKDVYTDWIKVEGYCRLAQSINDELTAALGSGEACAALYRRVAESGDLGAAKSYRRAWEQLAETRDTLFALLDVLDSFDGGEKPYALALSEVFSRWSANRDGLKDWMAWRLDREQAADAGLLCVIEAYEAGLPHNELLVSFERGVYRALSAHVLASDPPFPPFRPKRRTRC